jgi:hypothetical protein
VPNGRYKGEGRGRGMTSQERAPVGRRLRGLFARTDDPYAGADLLLARRMVALMWALAGVLAIAFLPFAPPTKPLGWIGWLILVAMIVGAFAVARFVVRQETVTFTTLLVLSYVGLVELAFVQWLTGGEGSPFAQLYLLAVIAGVGVHPPRRAAALLAALVVAAFTPIAYDGWAAAGDIAPRVLLWLALGFVVIVLMYNVRAQRVGMRAAEQRAEATARVDELTASETGAASTRPWSRRSRGPAAPALRSPWW